MMIMNSVLLKGELIDIHTVCEDLGESEQEALDTLRMTCAGDRMDGGQIALMLACFLFSATLFGNKVGRIYTLKVLLARRDAIITEVIETAKAAAIAKEQNNQMSQLQNALEQQDEVIREQSSTIAQLESQRSLATTTK